MPKSKTANPTTGMAHETSVVIYKRQPLNGPELRLIRRPDRDNLQIVWRDPALGPQKRSAKTADETLGMAALDLVYAELFGGIKICPTCQRCTTEDRDPLEIMDGYWAAHGRHADNPDSIRTNLGYVRRYISSLPRAVTVEQIDKAWIADFRKWLARDPYTKGKDPTPRYRGPATIEGGVMQLHAALKWAKLVPDFAVLNFQDLSRSPDYRADVQTVAAMFRYCLYPDTPHPKEFALQLKGRANLLTYLRFAVATWARPDAVLGFSLDPRFKQWSSEYKVVHLNPYGRAQTKKFRPSVPVPNVVAAWLDSLPKEKLFKVRPAEKTWRNMVEAIGLGDMADGEAGFKLVRRSMATIARDRLGEAEWLAQGERQMGHGGRSQSDTYAIPKPEQLGKALKVTAGIIADIETLCPGAFGGEAEADIANIVQLVGGLRSRQTSADWDAWRAAHILAPLPELATNVVALGTLFLRRFAMLSTVWRSACTARARSRGPKTVQSPSLFLPATAIKALG
jgi:hypothetical protein